ncbi:hypothetical protein D3C80_1430760 [compost metagenome]
MGNYIPLFSAVIFYWRIRCYRNAVEGFLYYLIDNYFDLLWTEFLKWWEQQPNYFSHLLDDFQLRVFVDVVKPVIKATTVIQYS